MNIQELQKEVDTILADQTVGAQEKTTRLLSLRAKTPEGIEHRFEWDMVILPALRTLIPSLEEEDQDVDIIYLNAMLAEAYAWHGQSYKVTDLAEEAVRIVMTLSPTICEAALTVDEALDRLTEVLRGTGHPRLTMNLISLRLMLAERMGSQLHDLTRAVRRLVSLGVLTEDRSLTEALHPQIESILSKSELEKIEQSPSDTSLDVDPVEYTERWEEIIDTVEQLTEAALADVTRRMGFCHIYWQTKQKILKKEFGVNWRSPADMNPTVMFD